MIESDHADAVPRRFNLAEYCLGRAAHRDPDRLALIELTDPADAAAGHRWTYRELDAQVRALAAGLAETGLRRGDRVVLRLGNSAHTPLAYLAVMAAGFVAVPTSNLLTGAEAAALTGDAEAAMVLLADDLPMPVPDGVEVIDVPTLDGWRQRTRDSGPDLPGYCDTSAHDPAFMIYTSGTAAAPKGVVHAHRSAWGRRPMRTGWLGIGPDDVVLHAGALSWTYTLGVGLVDPWAAGATAVVYTGPRPGDLNSGGAWWSLMAASGATVFAAVPGVYRQLLRGSSPEGRDLSRLRHGVVAGEALTPALWRQWRTTTGRELYEALGMTEISTFISSAPPGPDFDGVPTLPGSPGRAQPGRRIAALPVDGGTAPVPVGDIGVLAVHRSDPALMLGYWKRPDEDAAATREQWFLSGDLVSIDDVGYVHHHGRADDVMTSLGYRVSPLEVERALANHPAIADVGVAETEVGNGVRLVTAFVVPADPGVPVAEVERQIRAHAATHLASYKCPRRVVVLDALPRTANGKVKRGDLRGYGLDVG